MIGTPFRLGLALALLLGFSATLCAGDKAAGEPSPDEVKFFENHVRPVLANHCYRCHGAERQRGGLRLDSLAAMITGGDSGSALTPGKPDESLLIEAVNYDPFGYQMPPTGKLEEKDIAALTKWVELGAPWPGASAEGVVAAGPREKITDEDRAFWSFQPLASPEVPNVNDGGWSQTPIDRFIYARLAAEGLEPAEKADPRQLIRRVYFDLIGLPPDPVEVERFAADPSPKAFERIVDELLASPRYGERWGRHWLDLVRYAESDGWRQDAYRPHAWRYRDYVIESFNEDKPYDRFVQEQLAGDEIAPNDPDALVATGFLRHMIYEYNQRDARTQWNEILTDMTDTTADVFLGLGMGCARCHDHKFDPILQKDYFALQAFLAPAIWRDDVPAASHEDVEAFNTQLAAWEEATAEIRSKIEAIRGVHDKRAFDGAVNKFPEDIIAMVRKPATERTPLESQLAYLAIRQGDYDIERLNLTSKLKGETKTEYEELVAELKKFDHLKPEPLPQAMTVTDVGPEPPVTTIWGGRDQTPIEPAFLTVLGEPAPEIVPPEGLDSTGRRTALAKWLTQPDHPLTTRVIANRIWKYHFGRGLVPTTSDFGRLGEAPTHPELLDWLARRFVADGWSFKRMHRLILTSAVYQQTALRETPQVAALKDPTNRLLWRFNTTRLDADQIRDAMLFASGELRERTGGPSVDHGQPVRSIYTKVVRNSRDPFLAAFDFPMGFTSTPERNTTTTPTQALMMINGDYTLARAAALARRLSRHSDSRKQIEEGFLLAFGRAPTSSELNVIEEFLEGVGKTPEQRMPLASVEFPGRSSRGLRLLEDPAEPLPTLDSPEALPSGNFTVEAYIQLERLYADATVRTIAAEWNNHNSSPGWSLGVTSTKSSYTPRNLILQFVGQNAEGKTTYEVVPSGLLIDLNKPYYVAVSVELDKPGEEGITFFAKRLDGSHPLQTARVAHQVVSGLGNEFPLTIGGRTASPKHRWQGIIDDVRLSRAALEPHELLIQSGDGRGVVGHWTFESADDRLADSSKNALNLRARSSSSPAGPTNEALLDFCHVLLNSNEFLYVD